MLLPFRDCCPAKNVKDEESLGRSGLRLNLHDTIISRSKLHRCSRDSTLLLSRVLHQSEYCNDLCNNPLPSPPPPAKAFRLIMVTEPALYPDVSLSMKIFSPLFFLPMVPWASSPVTRVSLAFRARLCAKNEPPGEETGGVLLEML